MTQQRKYQPWAKKSWAEWFLEKTTNAYHLQQREEDVSVGF